MELLLVGIAVAINIIVIKYKVESSRLADAILDGTILVLLTIVFRGSYGGLVTATVASSVVSTYLWFYPPKQFFDLKKAKKDLKEKLKDT